MFPETRAWDGFTLVELMVVVMIIGILVTIAVPVYVGATNVVYQRSCQASQRTIMTAVLSLRAFGDDTATVGPSNAVLDVGSGWGTVLIPGYLKDPPRCETRGGGLYNMSPAGDILSDKGAGQTSFINQGQEYDHRLPEDQD